MKSLSVPNHKAAAGKRAFAPRFRPTFGHVLAALVLLSLLGWGLLFVAIKLAIAALG